MNITTTPAVRRTCVASFSVAALTLGLAADARAQALTFEVNQWITQDATDAPDDGGIVFVGSSSIRRWEQLSRDFADYDIIQRGFGGSQFSDLNPVVDQIVTPYNPSGIVVFEGTNDVNSGKSADTVFGDYMTFVDNVRASTSAPIFFLGITPAPSRAGSWPVALDVNTRISNFAAADPSLHYIDTATPYLVNGQPAPSNSSPFFVSDNLHLNQAGYDVFTDVIRPAVTSVIPQTKTYTPNPDAPALGDRILFDFGANDGVNGNHTANPDVNGNTWNNWHDYDGGLKILAGQRLNDLVDDNGNATGVDLIITGGFTNNGLNHGGLASPDPALLGDFAVDTVTQDYFFGNASGDSPAGFMLTGLDPDQDYDFKLFGTRNTAETRITEYDLLGETLTSVQLQTSGLNIGTDGVYDGNDDEFALITGVRPDEFGQFFLDLEIAGASFSYIGGLELIAVPEPAGGLLLALGGLALRRRR